MNSHNGDVPASVFKVLGLKAFSMPTRLDTKELGVILCNYDNVQCLLIPTLDGWRCLAQLVKGLSFNSFAQAACLWPDFKCLGSTGTVGDLTYWGGGDNLVIIAFFPQGFKLEKKQCDFL
jgi:hypothetical protein